MSDAVTATTITTSPFAPTSVARGDFPGWIPPMLVKELRQGLRTRGFVGTFIVFHALMALIMLGVITSATSSNASVRAMSLTTANGFFWSLLSAQLLLLTPGRALGGLQSETESRTLDLLMLTRLDAWRIVTGKWLSLVAQAVLLLVAMLPYGIVRYFAGSVDLVSDARICCALLGGAALLTAAGLWGAGMGKAFRILWVLAGVFASSIGSSALPALMRGGPMALIPNGWAVGVLWLDGALLLMFFLVAAVRNIAPPAENHALLARSLPLIALAAIPAASLLSVNSLVLTNQLIFAGIFLMVVSAVELASVQHPMLVHTRPWRGRAAMARVFFRMALPGWPSALLFATTGAVLWVFCALALDLMHTGPALLAWPAVLGLGALAFPAAVRSLGARRPRSPGGIYGLGLAVGVVLAVLSMTLPLASPRLAFLKDVATVLPVSSFVLSAFGDPPSVALLAAQGVVAVAVLGFAWWQARHYWHELALVEARDQAGKT